MLQGHVMPRPLLLGTLILAVTAAVALVACNDDSRPASGGAEASDGPGPADGAADADAGKETPAATKKSEVRADHITTRHVLLAHEGTPLAARTERTLAEALSLAEEIKKRVEGGASMAELVEAHSDDPNRGWDGGRRKIRNYGVAAGDDADEKPRGHDKTYSDAAFRLEPGDVAIVRHDLGVFVILREE